MATTARNQRTCACGECILQDDEGHWMDAHGFRCPDGSPREPVIPACRAVDQIVHWDEVSKDDLVLHDGVLKSVQMAYLHHRPAIGEKMHVEFEGEYAPAFFDPSDYTAVHRYIEEGA